MICDATPVILFAIRTRITINQTFGVVNQMVTNCNRCSRAVTYPHDAGGECRTASGWGESRGSTLSILEAVALAEEPIGLTQIARQLALSKAVFRYLRTLVERGYVIQNRETGRYRLGPKPMRSATWHRSRAT